MMRSGLRVVCSFLDDIYSIRDYIALQDGLEVVQEKDYIRNTVFENNDFSGKTLIPFSTQREATFQDLIKSFRVPARMRKC